VIVVALERPVGKVTTTPLSETIVCPAELTVVDAPTLEATLEIENVKVSPPFVILVARDEPVGSVTTTPLLEMTVWPAELTDVLPLAPEGTKVRVSPSVTIVVAEERPVGKVTKMPLTVPEMIV
jgi:hypothetical protein